MNSGFAAVHLPARFVSAGRAEPGQGWVHPRETLSVHALFVVRQGSFGMDVGGQRVELSAGKALFLPAGLEHCGFRTGRETPPVYYWAYFEDDSLSDRDRDWLTALSVDLREPVFNRMVSGFHQLISRYSIRKGRSEICDYLFSALLLEMQEEEHEPPRAAVADRMLEYIRLHCYEKMDWHDLSAALGYTEDYLSRVFHRHVDCPFRQYIHLLRMDRARNELLESEKTIQQIALDCGYLNAKFFTKVFLKCEGISPSAYRNRFGGRHRPGA